MPLLIKNAEEVYRYYLQQFGFDADNDPAAIALFAFSLVEREKFDWLEHYREHNGGQSPAIADIQGWYAAHPESYFDDKARFAIEWFKAASRALLRDELDANIAEAVNLGIVSTVKSIKSETTAEIAKLTGLKAFGVNVTAGFVAAILVSALGLFFYYLHVTGNPDPIGQVFEQGAHAADKSKVESK